MRGRITATADGILVVKGRRISIGHSREVEHGCEISFASGRFMVDAEKNLLRVENGRIEEVLRLRRGIFALVEDNSTIYTADRFGDVYRILNGGCRYVLGTLCYLTGMVVSKRHIVLSDKYGRIRVSERNGRIVCYRFEPHPIAALLSVGGRVLSFSNHGITLYDGESYEGRGYYEYESEIRSVATNGSDEFLILCSGRYHLFRLEEEIRHIRTVEDEVIDAVYNHAGLHRLKADGSVEDGAGS
jgi:hypothetical protein